MHRLSCFGRVSDCRLHSAARSVLLILRIPLAHYPGRKLRLRILPKQVLGYAYYRKN